MERRNKEFEARRDAYERQQWRVTPLDTFTAGEIIAFQTGAIRNSAAEVERYESDAAQELVQEGAPDDDDHDHDTLSASTLDLAGPMAPQAAGGGEAGGGEAAGGEAAGGPGGGDAADGQRDAGPTPAWPGRDDRPEWIRRQHERAWQDWTGQQCAPHPTPRTPHPPQGIRGEMRMRNEK